MSVWAGRVVTIAYGVLFAGVILLQVGYAVFFKPGVVRPVENSTWVVPKAFCSKVENALCRR